MGKIQDIITKKVAEKVTNKAKFVARVAVTKAATTSLSKLEQSLSKDTSKKDVKEEKNYNNFSLIYTFGGSYKILDGNYKIKYYVKNKFFYPKHHLVIKDESKTTIIAESKEKFLSFRTINPFVFAPRDFKMSKQNEEIGSLKSKHWFFKRRYNIECCGWNIDSNLAEDKYIIRNQNNEIIFSIKNKKRTRNYVVEIFKEEDEIICLLIALSICNSQSCKIGMVIVDSADSIHDFFAKNIEIIWFIIFGLIAIAAIIIGIIFW